MLFEFPAGFFARGGLAARSGVAPSDAPDSPVDVVLVGVVIALVAS